MGGVSRKSSLNQKNQNAMAMWASGILAQLFPRSFLVGLTSALLPLGKFDFIIPTVLGREPDRRQP